jgi:hypothetical protein
VESLGSDLLVHVDVDAPSVTAATGERIRLAVDPDRLHFFDPRTERALA